MHAQGVSGIVNAHVLAPAGSTPHVGVHPAETNTTKCKSVECWGDDLRVDVPNVTEPCHMQVHICVRVCMHSSVIVSVGVNFTSGWRCKPSNTNKREQRMTTIMQISCVQ